MTLVFQSEFARMTGIDKAHVTRLKQAGRLVMEGKKVNVEASIELIKQTAHSSFKSKLEKIGVNPAATNSQGSAETGQIRNETDSVGLPPYGQQKNAEKPENSHSASDAIGNSYQTAKAVNEKYKALTAKAEYEQLIGKLVDADEARLFAADLAASFRGALEILPDRLAPELVPLNDTEAVRALLVESFEQVLGDLADKIGKWGKD